MSFQIKNIFTFILKLRLGLGTYELLIYRLQKHVISRGKGQGGN